VIARLAHLSGPAGGWAQGLRALSALSGGAE